MRDGGGLDHPRPFELDRPLVQLLEQPDTSAEQQRNDVDLDLVEETGTVSGFVGEDEARHVKRRFSPQPCALSNIRLPTTIAPAERNA
jgi:hypothetical protein